MATVKKQGRGYKITVSNGFDGAGNRIRQHTTWVPKPGMTPLQIEKELNRQVVLFEEEVKTGVSNCRPMLGDVRRTSMNRRPGACWSASVLRISSGEHCSPSTCCPACVGPSCLACAGAMWISIISCCTSGRHGTTKRVRAATSASPRRRTANVL